MTQKVDYKLQAQALSQKQALPLQNKITLSLQLIQDWHSSLTEMSSSHSPEVKTQPSFSTLPEPST